MFKIFALIFIGVATTGEPAGEMKSKLEFDTKAACEAALKNDASVKKANADLKEHFTALGKAKGIKLAFKFECREDKKKDDGSI